MLYFNDKQWRSLISNSRTVILGPVLMVSKYVQVWVSLFYVYNVNFAVEALIEGVGGEGLLG